MQAFAHGAGFRGFGLRDPSFQPLLDPFLSVDHFWMSEPTFAPHPHAGFSAVTYLFDDSQTSFVNRDSLGHQVEIAAGDLHWTQAGAGVMHEELPRDIGRAAHGLQIFVNLDAEAKHSPPQVHHVDAAAMPTGDDGSDGSVRWRLVFGQFADVQSPLLPGSGATLLDVHLPAASQFDLPVAAGQSAFVVVIGGQVTSSNDGPAAVSPQALTQSLGCALAASSKANVLRLRTGPSPARLALFLGKPLREPVVWGGPFVMTTEADVLDAKRRFVAGGMGQLTAFGV